jgi:hypothetical protein
LWNCYWLHPSGMLWLNGCSPQWREWNHTYATECHEIDWTVFWELIGSLRM